MANENAWNEGWAQGAKLAHERHAHKQELSDQELQNKAQLYATQLNDLRVKLSSFPKGSPEYDDTFNAIQNTIGEIRNLYHPEKNPGALAKFGHVVTDALKITNPEDRIKATAHRREAASQGDERQAQALAAAAPVSQEEQATQAAQAESAGSLAAVRAGQKAFMELNPSASPEELSSNLSQLIQKHFGTTTRGSWTQVSGKINGQPATLNYDKNTNRYTYPTGEPVPPEYLETGVWVPDVKPSVAAKPPKGLKFETSTGEVLNQDTGKRYSVSDIGNPDTPPEVVKMFNDSKAMMDEKQRNALALANQRGISIGANRYSGFIDPNNPTQVIPSTFGEASKRGLRMATGPYYQAVEHMINSATSGPIGNEFVAFGTAIQHADLLQQAAYALNNNDQVLLNRVTNELIKQPFGDPAPSNFQTIAGAYTREITKALAAGHITDAEIAANGATIPLNASPAQISGAINAYKRLMTSKIQQRIIQVQSVLPEFQPGAPINPNENKPQAPKGGKPSQPKHYVGEVVTLKNGQKIKISVVHPDGSFE